MFKNIHTYILKKNLFDYKVYLCINEKSTNSNQEK